MNLKTSEENSKQPDAVCMVLNGTNWDDFSMVAEVKGEDQKDDKRVRILDLIRIGCMSAAAINQNLYDEIIGVHIVGLQITFYITSLQ